MELMVRRRYLPIMATGTRPAEAFLRLKDIAWRCQIQSELVLHFVRQGLVDPLEWDENPDRWRFERCAVARVQKIIRLHRDLGINYAGIGVVLELLDRIETLERRIRDLEHGLEQD